MWANQILQTNMAQLFEGISTGLGRTAEIIIGMQTYLCTSEHLVDVGTIVVMQNITYVKQLEKDRAEFMHALSHDMKSPLTSIMGWAQLLRQVIPMEDRGKQYLDKMIAAANRMLKSSPKCSRRAQVKKASRYSKNGAICRKLLITPWPILRARPRTKTSKLSTNKAVTPITSLPMKTVSTTCLNLVHNAIKYSPIHPKFAAFTTAYILPPGNK